MSTFRFLLRRGLGLSITLLAIGALLVFSGVALADQSEDLHCPDGWVEKDETGMDDNAHVPEAGLLICVKAGSPSGNDSELGNTGIILTDGESTLQEYLDDAGIVDGSGEAGRDVSYWVTYPDLEATLTIWKDSGEDITEAFAIGDFELMGGEYDELLFGNADLMDGSVEVTVTETLTEEQIAAGWALVEVECDSEAVEEIEDGVIVTLVNGDEITCTFFNELRAEEATPTPTPTATPSPTATTAPTATPSPTATTAPTATPTPTPTPTPAETGGVLPGNPTPTPAGGVTPDTALPVGSTLLGIGMALLMIGSLLTMLVARVRRPR